MAMRSSSPVTTPEPLPAEPDAFSTWLAGLSWLILLVLIPVALLATALEAGLISGRPHG